MFVDYGSPARVRGMVNDDVEFCLLSEDEDLAGVVYPGELR